MDQTDLNTIAEEVTVTPAHIGSNTKRPDIVIYVNGIALGVLELKRSTVSVAEASAKISTTKRRYSLSTIFQPYSW